MPRLGAQVRRALRARARAVELRTQSWTYQRIADAMGYANRGAVVEAVAKALAAQHVEAVESLRELETAHALQVGIWDRQLRGDVRLHADVAATLKFEVVSA
jgi:hypothetical protein